MKIKLSKSQWQEIGKTAGWIKPVVVAKKKVEDEDFNTEENNKRKKDMKLKSIREEKKDKEKNK